MIRSALLAELHFALNVTPFDPKENPPKMMKCIHFNDFLIIQFHLNSTVSYSNLEG